MTEYIWVKHPETGAVNEIPREALPMLRQSGWDALTDEEAAEREQAVVDETATAEQAMREQADEALSTSAPPQPPPAVPDDRDAREARIMPKENG